MSRYPQWERLINVVHKLRDPNGGCPWDLEQTNLSLLKHLTEESYEYIQAVEDHNIAGMKEELGDVLLQILLHARIAEQENKFSLEEVCQVLADKLVYRHPHVFGPNNENNNLTSEQVLKNWDVLKDQEKAKKGDPSSTLGMQDARFPSLYAAYKIGKKAKKLDFDWENAQQVLNKVHEEWKELHEELEKDQHDRQLIEEELGDLLFALSQWARHWKFDPEETLRKANQKFIKRFMAMEDRRQQKNLPPLSELSLDEKEALWQDTKRSMKA